MGKIVLTWSKKIFFIVAFFHFQLSIHPKKTIPLTQALKMFENNFCVPILHRITIKIFRNPAPVKKQFRPFCRVPDFFKITPPYCTVQYIWYPCLMLHSFLVKPSGSSASCSARPANRKYSYRTLQVGLLNTQLIGHKLSLFPDKNHNFPWITTNWESWTLCGEGIKP